MLQGLAIYYSETNQTLKAAQATAKYSAKVPEKSDARERAIELYFEAAQPLLDQQKFAEAVVILKEGGRALPKSAQLELALGVAYYGLRRFDDAADAFLRTIEIAPETEQPYTFLGKILDQIPSRLPQVSRAVRRIRIGASRQRHGLSVARQGSGCAVGAAGDGVALLEKSIALDAGDASAHFEMGTVLDRLQRFAEAAAEFVRAVNLAPSGCRRALSTGARLRPHRQT